MPTLMEAAKAKAAADKKASAAKRKAAVDKNAKAVAIKKTREMVKQHGRSTVRRWTRACRFGSL